jgi:hypothetical protein
MRTEKIMGNWKHYQASRIGTTCVVDHEQVRDLPYEMGSLNTGRQRVFSRWFVKITMPDGSEVVGEDPYNLRAALYDVDRQLSERGCILVAAGIEAEFAESGLSHNSGYGYLPNVSRAIHMMDLPPPRFRDCDNDEFVGKLIEQAVSGMFSRK